MQHGESGKKARPLSRKREAESVSDEIIQARRNRQKKTRRYAPGNFNVMGFGFYDLHEFLKHPPQCSSLAWYSLIISSDYCKPHTKI